ncbi:hypothetical protein [Halovenus halobia]|uniref:hypothetical protein n=1 Tax=Halovenus halobia TaxID=3396622 RepID=UPI003F575D79
MKQPPSETREESSSDTDSTGPRLVGALFVLTGLAHLVVPTLLLDLASRSYETILNVEFTPDSGASTRVRALGVGLVAAGAHLLYYDGVLPKKD